MFRFEPRHLGGLEPRQDVVHRATARLADPDPEPAEALRPELLDDRAKPVLATVRATLAEAELAERQGEVVRDDEQIAERRVLPREQLDAWLGRGATVLYALRDGVLIGALLNLWFWPLAIGLDPSIAFIPGASVVDNLMNWLRYGLLTSAGFDIPRAIVLAVVLALTSQSILTILRRATRRASFTPLLAQE